MSVTQYIRNDNRYVELAAFYDNLMTSGYYGYDSLASAAHSMLGDSMDVLEIGIGTGLFAEKLLQHRNYRITGVDFSKDMIDQARIRLEKSTVTLIQSDIRIYKCEHSFDALISCGGALCISNILTSSLNKGKLRLYSFCEDCNELISLLHHLRSLLKPDGIFIISIQGEHKDAVFPIKYGLTYQQIVSFIPGRLKKTYRFLRSGDLLGEQTINLIYFDQQEFHELFEAVGFTCLGMDPSETFCLFSNTDKPIPCIKERTL